MKWGGLALRNWQSVVNNVVRVTTIPVMMVGKPIIKLTAENTIKLYNYWQPNTWPLIIKYKVFSFPGGKIETGFLSGYCNPPSHPSYITTTAHEWYLEDLVNSY